jgi:2-amino-4-hydroxy-6-hydroxymethyldihydropteridine diphosphokinase
VWKLNVQETISNSKSIIILMGSNIRPERHLPLALKMICQKLRVARVSRVYESPPVGLEGENFLNAAVEVHTPRPPREIKEQILLTIEAELGRVRTENRFIPRTIDLDIVVVNRKVVDSELFEQAHMCLPVADLLPDLPDPFFNNPLQDLANQFQESYPIKERPDIILLNS